jgi:hypothetical protein
MLAKHEPTALRGRAKRLSHACSCNAYRLLLAELVAGESRDASATSASASPVLSHLTVAPWKTTWGYVKQGKVGFTFTDGHTETYEAGDAYYAPPGHTPHLYAGSEVVEFHPTAELTKTMEIVEKNMAAMSQDA